MVTKIELVAGDRTVVISGDEPARELVAEALTVWRAITPDVGAFRPAHLHASGMGFFERADTAEVL
ncbi:MAG TPA: hypothetical protein VF163_05445 [Micromonosporaceae bacterium]